MLKICLIGLVFMVFIYNYNLTLLYYLFVSLRIILEGNCKKLNGNMIY